MADYIDREAVLKLLKKACDECMDVCEEFDGILPDCNQCIMHGVVEGVPKIPAADVRPVVRGKWIEQEEWTGVCAFGFKEMTVGSFKCSVCGFEVDVSEGGFHYCPNCGAEMEGGQDDV